jgi:hypothetical protein
MPGPRDHDRQPDDRDHHSERGRQGVAWRQWIALIVRQPWIVAITVVLALVIAYWGWAPEGWPLKGQCGGGPNIWRTPAPHRECIGISDGSDPFNEPDNKNPAQKAIIEKINSVQRKISAENKEVAKSSRYVKVVLLMPLTVSEKKDSAIPLSQIEHSLEGAYTALRRINGSTVFGDPGAVKLQLLLANQGSRQEISGRFVKKVLEVSDPSHPLVGVVGLGSSLANTDHLADKLGTGQIRIPMVGAITSSDSLTGRQNFWSVSPSNTQYAQALRHFLTHQGKNPLRSGLIVSDTNNDPYTRTLSQAFKSRLRPYLKFPELTYTGGTTDARATPKIFAPVVTNLCNAVNAPKTPLDMVLYAGRVADFEAFAKALENRICKDHPLAVLVGATGFADAQRYEGILRNGNTTVIFASSSDPVRWGQNGPGTPPDFGAFADAFVRYGFESADLADGLAISHHDALSTVAMATRLAAQGEDTPQPEDVASQFSQLVLAYRVPAASGRLEFQNSARGRAVSRVIPLRQIGTSTGFVLPKDLKPYEVTPQ